MPYHKPFCVGLTGSIASGKSTIATYFAQLGIDIINADHIAKALVQPGQPALHAIIKHFGATVLTSTGELNRAYLRELITNHPNQRTWLENLLHPLIRKQIQANIPFCTTPYCIIEIPLLTDKSAYPYLNRVLLVRADHELQIARIMTRDNSSREQAQAMLAATQADEDKRQAIADDTLINTGSIEALQQSVLMLHTRYTAESKKL